MLNALMRQVLKASLCECVSPMSFLSRLLPTSTVWLFIRRQTERWTITTDDSPRGPRKSYCHRHHSPPHPSRPMSVLQATAATGPAAAECPREPLARVPRRRPPWQRPPPRLQPPDTLNFCKLNKPPLCERLHRITGHRTSVREAKSRPRPGALRGTTKQTTTN